jgi:hypothetical protein
MPAANERQRGPRRTELLGDVSAIRDEHLDQPSPALGAEVQPADREAPDDAPRYPQVDDDP